MAVKGSALGSHNGTAIDSPIAAMDLPDENGEWSEGGAGRRDMESIRRTIENAKGQVYALYAKALRQHPDLNGKFIFELVVEPDGRVTRLKLIQSDLRLRELEQQMLDKIAAIHFGKEKAAPTRVQYTFVMIPSLIHSGRFAAISQIVRTESDRINPAGLYWFTKFITQSRAAVTL